MKNSRTRGATKVPNVKLRPAQASGSRLNKEQAHLPRVGLRDDEATQSEVDLGAGNEPFAGIVLCATGDLDKRTLFARAQELGATRANDFTDQVTHLVADAPGSAKYRCAVERHLPILKASWVEEAYQTWLNGDVVDLEQTIIDHRLHIFVGVRLCITGMDDLEMRGRIHALLAREKGVYLKSLDKSVTHLLSCSSMESAKLRWASDHNQSKSQSSRIHLVWEEWFWDSLEFGGRWDESKYEITNRRPSRKSLSQIPQVAEEDSRGNGQSNVPHSQRTSLPSSLPVSILLGDDPPEYGCMNKDPQARQRFYTSIFQQRERDKDLKYAKVPEIAAQNSAVNSASEPLKHEAGATGAFDESKRRTASADQGFDTKSVLTRLANHRVASFGAASQSQGRQPFRRIVSSASTIAKDPQGSSLQDASTSRTELTSRLFVGYTFRAFGEAKGPNLRDALEAHGGRWITEEDEEADFLVVRLAGGSMYWREERDEVERAKYRTECWVERCIFEERICAPDEHVVFTPLKVDTPVPGSEKLCLSLSGLDTAEACWVKRLIRALGGSLSPTFSRQSTHLICPSGRGVKFDKAREWGVDVVGTGWLIDIATTGKIPESKRFASPRGVEKGPAMGRDVKQDMEAKGKATGDGNEDMIVDITNGLSQESEPSKRHGSSSTLFSNPKQHRLATPDTSQPKPLEPTSSRTRIPRSLCLKSEFALGKPSALLSEPSTALSPRKDAQFVIAPPPLVIRPSLSPIISVSPKKAGQISRHFSAVEVEQDRRTTLIPSSHSPSPLRMPSKPASISSPPIGETRGLRTAITALLGKRDTESREETDYPAQKRQGRVNKRPRPPSKAKSDLEPRRGQSPAMPFLSGSPPLPRLPLTDDVDGVPEDGHAGLRVVYEDPGQRAEKRRLIALFEGGTAPDASTAGGRNRPDPGNDTYDAPAAVTDARPGPKRKAVRKSTRNSAG